MPRTRWMTIKSIHTCPTDLMNLMSFFSVLLGCVWGPINGCASSQCHPDDRFGLVSLTCAHCEDGRMNNYEPPPFHATKAVSLSPTLLCSPPSTSKRPPLWLREGRLNTFWCHTKTDYCVARKIIHHELWFIFPSLVNGWCFYKIPKIGNTITCFYVDVTFDRITGSYHTRIIGPKTALLFIYRLILFLFLSNVASKRHRIQHPTQD